MRTLFKLHEDDTFIVVEHVAAVTRAKPGRNSQGESVQPEAHKAWKIYMVGDGTAHFTTTEESARALMRVLTGTEYLVGGS